MRYLLIAVGIVLQGWIAIAWIAATVLLAAILVVVCPLAWLAWRLWPAAPPPAPRRRHCPPCRVRLVRSWTGSSWWAVEQGDRFELVPMTPRHLNAVSRN